MVPEDGLVWSGNSYDNTGRLDANTWRHVAFIEQERPLRVHHDGDRAATDDEPFRWLMSSDVCKHCTESACLNVCPTGAIFRTELGTVVVQEDICNGCGYCVPACPFGVLDKRELPSEDNGGKPDGRIWKCTLCYDRTREGLTPACAQACPTESIQYGPLDELRERAEHRLEKVKAENIAAVIADIQAADGDAGTIVVPANATANPPLDAEVRDPIAHACYPALIKFLQSTPTSQPASGKLVGFQLFQRKRDFVAQLKAGLPTYLKLGCAPLLGDEINTLIQTMAMIGVKIAPAGIAAICPPCALAAAPIALPALTLTP